MIVAAAIVPASPLLMPSIAGDRALGAPAVLAALEALREELYSAHPDTLVLFAEGGTTYDAAFSLHLADPYVATLEEFGDLGYRATYTPDLQLLDGLQRYCRRVGLPISLSTDPALPFTAAVPLAHLASGQMRVALMSPAAARDLPAHYAMGEACAHAAHDRHRRIAVLACGNLSHHDGEIPPTTLAHEERLMAMIQEKNVAGLLQTQASAWQDAGDSITRPLSLLFGALGDAPVHTEVLAHTRAFGVGMCVAQFHLS